MWTQGASMTAKQFDKSNLHRSSITANPQIEAFATRNMSLHVSIQYGFVITMHTKYAVEHVFVLSLFHA